MTDMSEIKGEWIRALRSGEYAQGKFALRSGTEDVGRYCCLGVLCEVLVNHGLAERDENSYDLPTWSGPEQRVNDANDGEAGRFYWTGTIPDTLAVALGLTEPRVVSTLMGMNDGDETFAQIADYLEAR